MKVFFLLLAVTLAVVSSEPGTKDGHQPPPLINRTKLRRSPEPQGSDRRPTWNLDYQHKIYEGKDGQDISVTGGGKKLPGRDVEPHLGLQRSMRFRRSPEPQGSVVLQRQQYLDGPDRRPTWNLDSQHKIYEGKDGHISATGGGIKLPGRDIEPNVGLQRSMRFRRSPEPQGSVVLQRQQYLDGPDRRPTWNLDSQHKIYEGKDGHISATGGGIKLPGRDIEPNFGLQGSWRFRRSPEPQGSVVLQRQQYLDGPDRRPTWNLDYQHKIYEGKDGHISATGGANRSK